MFNYYELLGVSENADSAEIKRAYRIAVKKYHPDLHPNASPEQKKQLEAKTKELNEAYAVLSDPRQRKDYDLSYRAYSNYHDNSGSSFGSSRNSGDSRGSYSGGYGHGEGYSGWEDYGFGPDSANSGGSYWDNDFEGQGGSYGNSGSRSGRFTQQEWEEMQRQWAEFSRSKDTGWGDPFRWGSSSGSEYNPFERDYFNPFSYRRPRSRSPFSGLGSIFTARIPAFAIYFILFLLIVFGRWIFFFVVFYLIFKVLSWAIRAIAK